MTSVCSHAPLDACHGCYLSYGKKLRLMIRVSGSDRIVVPVCWRFIGCGSLGHAVALAGRRRCFTLPEAVKRKRFLAPLLVFILGIWLPFSSRVAQGERLGMPRRTARDTLKRARGYSGSLGPRQAGARAVSQAHDLPSLSSTRSVRCNGGFSGGELGRALDGATTGTENAEAEECSGPLRGSGAEQAGGCRAFGDRRADVSGWCRRYREEGEAVLVDRRLGKPSGKRVPVDEAMAVARLAARPSAMAKADT